MIPVGQADKAHAIDHKVGRQATPPQILSELTVAEKLKEAGFSEVQAAALTRAIEAAATAKAESPNEQRPRNQYRPQRPEI